MADPSIEEQIAAVERAVEHYADYARNLAEINREHGDEGSLGVEQMLVESTLAGLQSTAATLRSHAALVVSANVAQRQLIAARARATAAEAREDALVAEIEALRADVIAASERAKP